MSARDHRRNTNAVDGWGQRASEPPREWTLRMVDSGFASLILLLPFVWGGRQAMGHMAVVLLSGWTALWWAIHQIRSDRPRWKFSGAEPLFAMAIALVVLQTVALPESLKDQLSPRIDTLLAGWTGQSQDSLGVGPWSTLSFVPWQSWSDLVTLVSVMTIFFIAIQRLETSSDVHRILRWVSISGCLTGGFGIAQYLTSNGLFFWVYLHPDTTTDAAAKAAFTNANHFADFLAMALPAQLWWTVTTFAHIAKLRDARSMNNPAPEGWRGFVIEWFPATILGITLCALVLSQSRGGLLAAGVGMTVVIFLFWRQKLLDSRTGMGLLMAGGMALSGMFLFGQGLEKELTENIEAIKDGSASEVDRSNSRQKIWSTDWKIVQDFPMTGTGLGSHRYVYKSYFDYPADGTEYTHAENGYLQVAMETGVTGIIIAGLAILLSVYWCVRCLTSSASMDIRGPAAVSTAVLAINLTHSVTDFIWYVPGCMVIVVILLAAACALSRIIAPEPKQDHSQTLGRIGWGLSLAVVLIGVPWGVQIKWPEVAAEPHYMEYRRLVHSEMSDGDEGTRFEIQAILKAAMANPHDPEIQNRAARAWFRSFLLTHKKHHDLSIEEIQQAATSSGYSTREELYAWLDNPDVIGKNRRYLNRSLTASLAAMKLCPLDERPYLGIAKLGWLTLMPSPRQNAFLEQALRGRPHEGIAHLEVAHLLLNRGELQEAEKHYQIAFQQDARCREALIMELSPHVPATFFLEKFELDRRSLAVLRDTYRSLADQSGFQEVLKRLAAAEVEAAQESTGELAASHLVTAHGCYAELGDRDRAIEILQKSLKRYGSSYNLRSNLANTLFDFGRYSEAIPHLEWCHRRQPDNDSIAQRIEIALQREGQMEVAEEEAETQRIR